MMDWRTLDKVFVPYENAHRFSLYSDRPVTRSLEISQRSSGAPVILQKSSALVFSSFVTVACGWLKAEFTASTDQQATW